MTHEDFGKLVDAIKAYYPRENALSDKRTLTLWFDMLCDLDYQAASCALRKHVALSKFPPTISELRENAASLTEPAEMNEMEAWAIVRSAIRNGTYHSAEEFNDLPPLVQKAVGLPDQLRIWATDDDYSDSVISSHFIKCYRTVCDREMENSRLDPRVRALIQKTLEGSPSAMIEQKRQEAKQPKPEKLIERKTEPSPVPERLRGKWEELMGGLAI